MQAGSWQCDGFALISCLGLWGRKTPTRDRPLHCAEFPSREETEQACCYASFPGGKLYLKKKGASYQSWDAWFVFRD
jgi:hypothetical protein